MVTYLEFPILSTAWRELRWSLYKNKMGMLKIYTS